MKTTTIIIPNIDNDKSDNSDIINKTISALVDMNGGATAIQAKGFWKSDEGKLYCDDVTVIQSATTQTDDILISRIADNVLKATDQEAVYYEHNGYATIKNR